MHTGQTTEHFDVAFLAINAFFLFFAALVVYLRREDKREGYPLVGERPGETTHGLFPATPPKKAYLLQDGSTLNLPREPNEPALALKQAPGQAGGTPFLPTGNPMRDAVGPSSYANRQDHPDETWEGEARIVPLRVAKDFWLDPRDPDARGWQVVAADGKVAGTVKEAWIDRIEPQVFYYEVAIAGGQVVILPARLAVVDDSAHKLLVESITAAQFADVPRLKNPDQITLLEEDKISGYYAGGHLFAEPSRQEPFA